MQLLMDLIDEQTPYQVITLSGSNRFSKDIHHYANELVKNGYVVLEPLDGPIDDSTTELEIQNIHNEHYWKLDHGDILGVIDVNGYFGLDTAREIFYAYQKGKPIRFLEPPKENSLKNLQTVINRESKALYERVTQTIIH